MFRCKDLFNLPSLSSVKLLCGEDGLSNTIRWAYKAESQDIKNWVKGNELLIISGAIIDKKDFNLSELILEAIELNLSGALILVGNNYVKSLSKAIIKTCNEKNFPIFLIGWSTPLIDIFEELGHAIVLSGAINQNIEGFIGNIIFGDDINEEKLMLQASQINYPLSNNNHSIFLINLSNTSNEKHSEIILNEAQIPEFKKTIADLFNKNNFKVVVCNYGTNIVGIYTHSSSHTTTKLNTAENSSQTPDNKNYYKEKAAELLNIFINDTLIKYPHININIGVGQSYSEITLISRSFNEASKCISICSKLQYKNKLLIYENIGILKVFFEIKNKELLKNYRNEMLESLMKYDQKNKSNLIETLKIYLDNDCNILSTSHKMNIHRNTIKYRINRIEDILNVTLTDSFVKLNIHNALLIHFFLL